jgi:CubicO group peptidase (beta-lactamase class C family)
MSQSSKDVREIFMISGNVEPGFERVRNAFAGNFANLQEIGAACSAYYRGKKVVDLWGGYANQKTREEWQADTSVLVFSVTKGLASMAMALAHSRGWLDYDEKISRYWPEFAVQGKSEITVRQLLSHQAGLPYLDKPVSLNTINEPEQLGTMIARQRPLWEPGKCHGYHAYSLGWIESELLRRVDPHHRTLGVFFDAEIAQPLGLEFRIGLKDRSQLSRLARMHMPNLFRGFLSVDPRMRQFLTAILQPWTHTSRTFMQSMVRSDVNDPAFLMAENPGFGGVGTARAIAAAYDVFCRGGRDLQITPATFEAISEPSPLPDGGDFDLVLKMPMRYSLGYMKPHGSIRFGSSERAFGAPGAGGAFAFADPDKEVAFAYVSNRFGLNMLDDPREVNVRNAVYNSLS